mmetsp:Transcript_4731/g.14793  ORF Transcript_4731/g.14793 Transcript_4731/m.14793 type:complete len:509 (-) Transcript_4731:1018-2544(-)
MGRQAVPQDRQAVRVEGRRRPQETLQHEAPRLVLGLQRAREGRRGRPQDGRALDLVLLGELAVYGSPRQRLHAGHRLRALRVALAHGPHRVQAHRLGLHAPDHHQSPVLHLLLPRHPPNPLLFHHAAARHLRHPRHRRRRRLRVHGRLEAEQGHLFESRRRHGRRPLLEKARRLRLRPRRPGHLQHVLHDGRRLLRDGHLRARPHPHLRHLRRPLRHHELRPRPHRDARHRRHPPPQLRRAQTQSGRGGRRGALLLLLLRDEKNRRGEGRREGGRRRRGTSAGRKPADEETVPRRQLLQVELLRRRGLDPGLRALLEFRVLLQQEGGGGARPGRGRRPRDDSAVREQAAHGVAAGLAVRDLRRAHVVLRFPPYAAEPGRGVVSLAAHGHAHRQTQRRQVRLERRDVLSNSVRRLGPGQDPPRRLRHLRPAREPRRRLVLEQAPALPGLGPGTSPARLRGPAHLRVQERLRRRDALAAEHDDLFSGRIPKLARRPRLRLHVRPGSGRFR